MKRQLLYIVITLIAIVGCKKEKPDVKPLDDLCGEWKSIETPGDESLYLNFQADGSFELFQKTYNDCYQLYRGTWSAENNVVSGTYNDGKSWGQSYRYQIAEDVLILTPTDKTDDSESSFVKKSIPDVVRTTCEVIVKSY